MWDEAAALDLRRKAEDYLRGYRPRGYEPSERATADAVRIREDIRPAYYWHDEGLHKNAVDEMVISTVEDHARWLREWRSGVNQPSRVPVSRLAPLSGAEPRRSGAPTERVRTLARS